MRTTPRRLTEAVIADLSFRWTPYLVRDTAIKGFMIAINTGCKSYKVQRDLWVAQRGCRRKVKTVRRTPGTTEGLDE